MSTAMIRRIAKAMQQRAKEPVGNIKSLEPVLVGSLGDTWLVLARVAIETMREPSKEMLTAGYTLCISQDNMNEIYQAMIDAALKE